MPRHAGAHLLQSDIDFSREHLRNGPAVGVALDRKDGECLVTDQCKERAARRVSVRLGFLRGVDGRQPHRDTAPILGANHEGVAVGQVLDPCAKRCFMLGARRGVDEGRCPLPLCLDRRGRQDQRQQKHGPDTHDAASATVGFAGLVCRDMTDRSQAQHVPHAIDYKFAGVGRARLNGLNRTLSGARHTFDRCPTASCLPFP